MFSKTFKLFIILTGISACCYAQTEQTYTVCYRQKVFVNDLLTPPISENSNNACTAIIRTVNPTSGVSDYGNGYFVFYDKNETFTITSQRIPSSDVDICDAGPKVKQTIQIIVEDCTSKPLKEVEESADQIFKDYPRLLEIVDGGDCANEQVTVHKSGNGNIYYEYEDATNNIVYSNGGNFLCLNRPNEVPCSSIYDFTEVLATWACANQPAIEGCTNETACNYNPKAVSDNNTCFFRSANNNCLGQCYPPAFLAKFGCTDPSATNYFADAFCDDGSCLFEGEATIFDRYPYLLDYFDPANCNGEKITVYNFVIGIEVLLEVENGSYVFYSTGAAACTPQNEAILGESCIDFLFRDTSNVVETWECSGENTFNETIDDIIKSKSELSFFSIATTSYAQDLSLEGPFTVFAPTNNALTSVYPNIATFGFVDPPTSYVETINNHVVEGIYLSTDLYDGQILTSIIGVPLFVTINDGNVFINDAQVTATDFQTTNGVVHIIDKVLLIENIPGCTNPKAINYNPEATEDDGSCDLSFPEVSSSDDIFEMFPWLIDIVDPTNCGSNTITVYETDFYQSIITGIYIENDNGASLYDTTGLKYCTDGIEYFSCLDSYQFFDIVDSYDCDDNNTQSNTVVDIIANSNVHNTLEAAISAAGLTETLKGDGPFTIFAPTDDAFAALPEGTIDALLADPTGDLTQILLYHVLGTQVESTSLTDGQTATTLNGTDIAITINDNGVFINDAKVTVADITTDNGVVHVINAILLPQIEQEPVETQVFEDYNWLSNLVNNTTCTDEKITVYQSGIYQYIYIENANGGILYNETGLKYCTDRANFSCLDFYQLSNIIGNWNCSNNGSQSKTVVDIIVNSDDHNSLESALITAGLAETLSGEGPFIVFAPTDDAFRALPPESLGGLFVNASGGLTDLLLYHVLEANVLSSDLSNGQTATTLRGSDITVTLNNNGVFINDAKVTVTDIIADNGVVHVLDAVLIPPPPKEATVFDIIANSVNHNILEESIKAADLEDALSGDGPFTVFAPTDAAFVAFDETIDRNELVEILTYHVLGAKVLSTDLSDQQTAQTLNGDNISVKINDVGIFINDAKVTIADIETVNGVVHIIDAVLSPSSQPSNSILEDFPWLSSILSGTDCSSRNVKVYDLGAFQYIFVESAVGGTLYFEDGTRYCSDRLGLNCREFYGLNENVAIYNCADEVEQPDSSSEIFNEFGWLSSIIDELNCNGTTVKVYNEGTFQYVFIETAMGSTLYFEDGTRYCGNRANLNCEEFYGLEEFTAIYICEGGNFVINQRNNNANFTNKSGNNFNKIVFDDGLDIKLYPNPTNNYVQVELMQLLEQDLEVILYDVSGKIIQNFTTTDNFKLDLTTQTEGVYLLELRNEDNIQQHKIMKY